MYQYNILMWDNKKVINLLNNALCPDTEAQNDGWSLASKHVIVNTSSAHAALIGQALKQSGRVYHGAGVPVTTLEGGRGP